jgi:hypothetical protein
VLISLLFSAVSVLQFPEMLDLQLINVIAFCGSKEVDVELNAEGINLKVKGIHPNSAQLREWVGHVARMR